jgi:uncharacterized protein (TIGR00369 family)
MTDRLAAGRAVLAAQPFSVLLGAELTRLDATGAVLELPLRAELLQQFGFAHGGVVGYLADNALTFAGATVLGEAVVTVEMKINYLRPAIGERLIARAVVVSAGQTLAVTRCDIYALRDDDEIHCASAQGTIAKIVPKERA